jgi:hypothetical protein
MADARPRLCADCGSPLAPEQIYCLACGARNAERSPQLQEMLGQIQENGAGGLAGEHAAAPAAARASAVRGPLGLPALAIPSAKASALLLLVFLGFGVLLGGEAGSSVQETLAASASRHISLVLPPSAAPAAKPSGSSESSGSGEPSSESPPEASTGAETAAKTTSTKAAAAPVSEEGESGGGESSSGEGGSSSGSAAAPLKKLPPVKHVFVITLSDQPYASVFGPSSTSPYISKTLEKQGELLVRYDAVAHEELANGVALISGQGPTVETAANCQAYSPLSATGTGEQEQVLGNGCVYPQATKTLPGQLTEKHLTWRAYVQGMDESGTPIGACGHPVLGQADPTAGQSPGSGTYSTFRNPFVYFQSIVSSSSCASNDVGMSSLKADLASAGKTPNVSYIVPDRCHDGNPTPCSAGAAAGLKPAEGVLKTIVPEITSSKAFKADGLLIITVDQAPSTGELADSSSCCGQPKFPNVPSKSTLLTPRGGGSVGALLISPYVKGATTSQEPFNHFSLLRTMEDMFGLSHIGYGALPAVKPLEPALFVAKG